MAAAAKPQDSSSSKRHFHWTKKVGSDDEPVSLSKSSSSSRARTTGEAAAKQPRERARERERSRVPQVSVARLRSAVLTAFRRHRSAGGAGALGSRVVGTLFGSRRGHVHFALQREAGSAPAFLIELATPIGGLVKEMASGLVRIALECDKPRDRDRDRDRDKDERKRLLEESVWRTYCNGKKCGFATRRECGPRDWKILKAVEPISMGAGVLPSSHRHDQDQDEDHDGDHGDGDDQVMYMRAKFERIVGSRDSEAFYMMNPDSNGAPELSIYLLRV